MDALDRIVPPLQPGERLVLRHRLPDGSATDVLGWLERTDEDALLVETDGDQVTVQRSAVLAARRVPAARGGRDPMRTSPEELQQIALPAWLAGSEPLGEWTLRSGGGFTGRANSCLAVGDPGVSLPEAARRIIAYSAAHGIPPRAQVVADSEVEHELRALGWQEGYVRSLVMVTRLAELLGSTPPHPRVRLSDEPDEAWWAAYQESRPNSADPAVLRAILVGGQPRALAGVGEGGRLIAIGRGHVSRDWLGLSSLWTDPGHRRQGWAGRVIITLGHWAARLGARSVYLQVAEDNTDAVRAYQRQGFAVHHGYRYLTPP